MAVGPPPPSSPLRAGVNIGNEATRDYMIAQADHLDAAADEIKQRADGMREYAANLPTVDA